MTRQTTEPLRDTHLSATNRSAREIARMVWDGYLDLNPPYQRGAVWTVDQQIALVRSWLTGVPVPAVIWNDRGGRSWADWAAYDRGTTPGVKMYAMVDGQQRVRTAMDWFGGYLLVPASWFDPSDVVEAEETDDGPYVRYTGLSEPFQRHMAFGAMLPACEAQLPTLRDEAALYCLVNGGGTPQTDDDMARAARVVEDGA